VEKSGGKGITGKSVTKEKKGGDREDESQLSGIFTRILGGRRG